MDRVIPLYTTEGVPDARISLHPFSTEDKLGLSLQRFSRGPSDDVVLLVHGHTTSTDMFIMPERYNLVRYLLDHGYSDVWSLDSRMSNRFSYNLAPHDYNLDDLALFDYPPAVAKIREHIGSRRLHVISHGLGAISFSMSLFGGAVSGITSLLANSAALTPRVPFWSLLKLAFAPLLLHAINHKTGGDFYGGTGLPYQLHLRAMVHAGRAVKLHPGSPRYARLPDDYLSRVRDVTTPVLLVTGGDNKVFEDSNIVCHRVLSGFTPGRHSLDVFPGYGHGDVFTGKDSHADVFPRLVDFLREHRGAPLSLRRVASAYEEDDSLAA